MLTAIAPQPSAVRPFACAGVVMTFARGEELYAQAEPADLLYEIVSGCVRTSRLAADGRRQIGGFYYPGDVLGIEAGGDHRFAAEALTDCTAVAAPRSRLAARLGVEAAVRLETEALTAEFARAQDHVLVLGCKTACERVARFLLDAADRQCAAVVDLPMGRQDIADFLGLTIETVSRMITQLQTAGLVDFTTCRTFTVRDRVALTRLGA